MKRSILTLVIIPMLLFIGCAPTDTEDVVVDADSIAAAGQDELMDFRADVDENLAEIDTKLDSLQIYADIAAEDISAEIDSTVAELREKRDSVQMDLQQLEVASEDTYDDVRMDIELELNELESEVEMAWERYRDEDDVPDAS